jgi:hypothetical protein
VVTGISPDTGLSSNDGVTDARNLVITGQAPENTTVSVYNNGQFIGTAVTGQSLNPAQAVGANTWVFDNTATSLPDGTYYITATATDTFGTTSAPSFPYTVIVNTQTPVTPTIAGLSPNGGGGSGVITISTPTLFGTSGPNSAVTISRSGQVVGTTFADSSGAWNYTNAALSNGTYTFAATDTNLAGDVSPLSTPYSLTVAVPVNTPVIAGVSQNYNPWSGSPSLVIGGTTTPGNTVVVALYGSPVGQTKADNSGNWLCGYAPAGDLAAGTYSFTATALDPLGNASAPSRSFLLQYGGGAPWASTPRYYSNSSTSTFRGRAMPGNVVTILDGDTILGAASVNAYGSWSFTGPALAAGKHTIAAEATNASGVTGLLSGCVTITV